MNRLRIQKFLAAQGVASRREIEKMIGRGLITVNGTKVEQQGLKIDPETDIVAVDGTIIKPKSVFEYFALNKPVGYTSTTSHRQDELIVTDLIDSVTRLYPIGRLDKDSQGLLLLTNDGELTHKLIHPKYHVDKTYTVRVSGIVTQGKLARMRQGIRLEEGVTLPATVEIIQREGEDTWLTFVLREGKHRQIRRMCSKLQLHVVTLIRKKFGPIELGDLGEGQARELTQNEINALKAQVGLNEG